MNLSTKILRRIHESISKAREDYNQKFEARFGYTSATEEIARRRAVQTTNGQTGTVLVQIPSPEDIECLDALTGVTECIIGWNIKDRDSDDIWPIDVAHVHKLPAGIFTQIADFLVAESSA